jgi:3-hydroxyacyl-CoA dehydrogenase/enoyl-CoA hydratase/3-hydroxybutyryl-CoA epimerase
MLFESESVRVEADRGVATLWLDFPGAGPNQLNLSRLNEIDTALNAILPEPTTRVLVIRSAHSTGFCSGAAVDSFPEAAAFDEARDFAACGQRVLSKLANAECITVAIINGPCLGPGLELALACDYRIAVATATSVFGFGPLPCAWGGLSRLTRIAGAARACEVIRAAEPLTARTAVKMGVIDRAFCTRIATIECRAFVDQIQQKPRRWHTPFDAWAARRVVASFGTKHPHSKYPLMVVPAAAAAMERGLAAERRYFAQALATLDGKSRLKQEHMRQRLHGKVAATFRGITWGVAGPLTPVANIVAEALVRGGTVHATDAHDMASVERQLRAACSAGRATPLETEQARRRLVPARSGVAAMPVLLTLDTAAAMEQAESLAGPARPVLAATDRHRVAPFAVRPARLFGVSIHGALAELAVPQRAISGALSDSRAALAALGFTPLITTNRRGLVLARLEAEAWDEAVALVTDGVPIAVVDAAARRLGARAGLLEALDSLGFDSITDRVPAIGPLVAAGLHGGPSAEGFYHHAEADFGHPNVSAQLVLLRAAAPGTTVDAAWLNDGDAFEAERIALKRLTARIINAAAATLAADARLTPAELDFAIVEAFGWFAHSGGPLAHAERRGVRRWVKSLRSLAAQFGPRFRPHVSLKRLALSQESLNPPNRSLRLTA